MVSKRWARRKGKSRACLRRKALAESELFQRAFRLPKLVQVTVGAAKIGPGLGFAALDFGDKLDAPQLQLLSCGAHILDLKGQNRTSMERIETAFRAEDLEQLPRRHLKLNHPLTLMNSREAQHVAKEARS